MVSVAAVSGSKGTHHRHRFALTYNDAGKRAGLPAAVFTESLPTLVTRMIGGYNGTARAEGRFYTQIRPHLAIESPLGYHAAFDRETLAGVNVLEDIVVTKDATFPNYKTLVTRPMAEEMIDLLAELHGASWNDPRLDTEWKWVAGFADWFRVGSQKMQTEYYTQRSLDKAAHLVPKRSWIVARTFGRRPWPRRPSMNKDRARCCTRMFTSAIGIARAGLPRNGALRLAVSDQRALVARCRLYAVGCPDAETARPGSAT